MKSHIMGVLLGGVTAGLIVWISGYWIVNWQFWVAFLPVLIIANIWVHIEKT